MTPMMKRSALLVAGFLAVAAFFVALEAPRLKRIEKRGPATLSPVAITLHRLSPPDEQILPDRGVDHFSPRYVAIAQDLRRDDLFLYEPTDQVSVQLHHPRRAGQRRDPGGDLRIPAHHLGR